MAITRRVLSGSSFGQGIIVSGTVSTALTTIHVGGANTSTFDEVFLFASNRDSASAAPLHVYFGNSTTTNVMVFSIPPRSTEFIIPGLTLLGSTSQSDCTIWVHGLSGGTNASIFGYVNRIT